MFRVLQNLNFLISSINDDYWSIMITDEQVLQTTNILVLIVFFMICICVSETNHNKKYCTTLIIMIKCTFVKKVLLLDF